MKMQLSIHQANESHAEVIAPLFDQYREFYKQPLNSDATLAFLRTRLSNQESVIFFAMDDNKNVVGFTQLFPSFSSIALKRLWILNDLFVVHEARRQSVAKKLLEKAAMFAKETNARGLTLKTATDNLTARALYESIGWTHNTRFQNYDLLTTPS